MTSAEHSDPKKILVLTPEDLEAALRMLAEEERAASVSGETGFRNFVSALIENLLIGLFYFSLFSGLVVVWFHPWTGLKLLGACLVAFVLWGFKIALAEKKGFFDPPKGPPGLAEIVKKAWDKKFKAEGCVTVPGCLFWLGGLGWMLIGLVTDRDVFPRALIPIALGSLMIAIANAIATYRKSKYFSRVSRMRDRLQVLQEVGPEQTPATVEVSDKDRALLGQVEIRQVARAAAKSSEEFGQQARVYSVGIENGPRDYLGGLDEETRYELREVLDDLQAAPKPTDSRVVRANDAGDVQTIQLEAGGHIISYVVDSARQRVDVIQISPLPREVQHA